MAARAAGQVPGPTRDARDVLARRTVCAVDHRAEDEVEGARTAEHYTGCVEVDTTTFTQRAVAGADLTVHWQDASVRARADLTMDAGPRAFDIELTVQTWCDGEPFAARSWSRSVPRDLG